MATSPLLTWHIVKKDLRRLRWPLALWIVVLTAKVIFFAAVTGVIGSPMETALSRLQSGPEMLLSLSVDLLMAYFLVGFWIFEDSLVEGDAFWITRPISGGGLLAAKVLGAVTAFVIVPLVINLPWWIACGFDLSQLWATALLTGMEYGLVVGIGFTVAALTNGFPRFILWSVAGCSGVILVLLAVSYFLHGASRSVQMTVLLPLELALMAAVVCHQFLTRRRPRSLGLLVVGTVLVAFFGLVWPWNWNRALMQRLTGEPIGTEVISANIAGPSEVAAVGKNRAKLTVPVRFRGVPPEAFVFAHAKAEWSWNGQVGWKSQGSGQGLREPRSSVVGAAHIEAQSGELHSSEQAQERLGAFALEVSPLVAARISREPSKLRANVELHLYGRYLDADMPLRNQSSPTRGGSASIAGIELTTMTAEMHRRLSLGYRTPIGSRVILLNLVRRFGDVPGEAKTLYYSFIHPAKEFMLVQPITGEVFAGEDSFRGFALLNSVGVLNQTVVFVAPSKLEKLDGLRLRIYGFENDRLVRSAIEADPFQVISIETIGPSPKS